ncbi:MAG: carbohydrate ABC transporter permease [Clostridia bacterium]|nr:carbohydrate ABC transporter permease [Clostridia bacterium]
MKRKNIFKKFAVLKDPFALIFYVIMIIYAISMLLPCYWMIVSTFKDRLEFHVNIFGFPERFTFENYLGVFSKMYVSIPSKRFGVEKIYVPELMFNGFSFSVCVSIGSLIMQFMVAYGCAKFKSVVGSVLYAFAIVTMILPLVGTMSGTLVLYKRLGIYDNFGGLIFAMSGWGGSNFLIMCAAFKGISDDYRDAAYIDGASQVRIMISIMLPMMRTILVALFILGFIGMWNDYQTPMIYLPSMPTIAYGLFQFRYSSDSEVSAIPMQITGCVVVMVPIILLFLFFRNKIMGNLTLGGLKG